ncbi:MAG: putative ubiquitin fusion degradation protein [Streblomastix strix]|uniref:Putative ubiquitin fusion degradation protein n=1 Tax=Streblomastix strix TaxID=222440 RepID=A0A5J4WQT6_9EUKA|nr:MAG: putative ubiquitin fusion degradation protein [Streblomastix strix]
MLSANSIAVFGKQLELEDSGKVILSTDILQKYESLLETGKPLIFMFSNTSQSKSICAGVADFSGDRGRVFMPYWMMCNLEINEDDKVIMKAVQLESGQYVKFKPLTENFYKISNPKAVLEYVLRNHASLTKDSTITFLYNKKKYELYVQELKPKDSVCIINSNISVELTESEQPIKRTPSPDSFSPSITPPLQIYNQQGIVGIDRKTSPSNDASGLKKSKSPPPDIVIMPSLSVRLQAMKTGAIQGSVFSSHSPPPQPQAYFESIPKTRNSNEFTLDPFPEQVERVKPIDEHKQKTKGNSPPCVPWEVQEENQQTTNPAKSVFVSSNQSSYPSSIPRMLIDPPLPPINTQSSSSSKQSSSYSSSEQQDEVILFGTKSKTEEEEEKETKQWYDQTRGYSLKTVSKKNDNKKKMEKDKEKETTNVQEKEKEKEKINEKEKEKEKESSNDFWSQFGSGHKLK